MICVVVLKRTVCDVSLSHLSHLPRSLGKFLRDPALDASEHDEKADCLVCQAGFYADSEGTANCTGCLAGTHLAADDGDDNAVLHDEEADCAICDAGSYSSVGSSSCQDW